MRVQTIKITCFTSKMSSVCVCVCVGGGGWGEEYEMLKYYQMSATADSEPSFGFASFK